MSIIVVTSSPSWFLTLLVLVLVEDVVFVGLVDSISGLVLVVGVCVVGVFVVFSVCGVEVCVGEIMLADVPGVVVLVDVSVHALSSIDSRGMSPMMYNPILYIATQLASGSKYISHGSSRPGVCILITLPVVSSTTCV